MGFEGVCKASNRVCVCEPIQVQRSKNDEVFVFLGLEREVGGCVCVLMFNKW